MMTDEEFQRRLDGYMEHMTRFIEVHRRDCTPMHAEILIELQRQKCWRNAMGDDIAAVMEPPKIVPVVGVAEAGIWRETSATDADL